MNKEKVPKTTQYVDEEEKALRQTARPTREEKNTALTLASQLLGGYGNDVASVTYRTLFAIRSLDSETAAQAAKAKARLLEATARLLARAQKTRNATAINAIAVTLEAFAEFPGIDTWKGARPARLRASKTGRI